jgi:hypothetical protein
MYCRAPTRRTTVLKTCFFYRFAKGRVVPVLFFNWAPRHEGVLWVRGIGPRILDLGTRWRWVFSFTPRPLYPQGKSPWYPLYRRLGGRQRQTGRGGEEKNFQPLAWLEPRITQTVAQRYTNWAIKTTYTKEIKSRLNLKNLYYHSIHNHS